MTRKKGAPREVGCPSSRNVVEPRDQFPTCSVRGQCRVTPPSLFLPTRRLSCVPHRYCSPGREDGDGDYFIRAH